jgi:hypothetical protein
MAFNSYHIEIPESPSIQDRLNEVRTFGANAALSRVTSLLDTGRLLLLTAKRFDLASKARANCLHGAKRCQSRVEEDMLKFQGQSEFSQLTADIDRLNCEISALAAQPYHVLEGWPRQK